MRDYGMSDNLKSTALAVSLLALSSVTAVADEDYMSPMGDWNGFYFGGHAGYVDVTTSGSQTGIVTIFGGDEPFSFSETETDSTNSDGGIFGAQIGYNIHAGEFLVGVEADGSFLSVDSVELDLKDTYSADYDWFATLRGRMGLVHDNTLIFATGGLAFTQLETDIGGSSDVATGFAVGGGVEHMFTPRWSGKIEYLYANFNSIGGVAGIDDFIDEIPADIDNDDPVFESEFHIIRAGVNFHF